MTANYFIPCWANTAIRFFQEPHPATTPSILIATTVAEGSQRYLCCTGQANHQMPFSKQTRAGLCKPRQGKYPTELVLSIQWACSQFSHTKPTSTSKPLAHHNPSYNTGCSKYRRYFQARLMPLHLSTRGDWIPLQHTKPSLSQCCQRFVHLP
jgi:hypothetical protein